MTTPAIALLIPTAVTHPGSPRRFAARDDGVMVVACDHHPRHVTTTVIARR